MLIERNISLFDGDVDAIAHGCNTCGVMGAGVAKLVADKWPEMIPRYRSVCNDGDFRLGGILPWFDENGFAIYNLATQVNPGPNARLAAVASSLILMMQHATESNKWNAGNSYRRQIGIPRIGCGIGGLEWTDVREVVEMVCDLYPKIDIVVYTP